MFKYQDESATPAGEFTDGDALLDLPRTLLRSSWLNMVQRELLQLVTDAGIVPAEEDFQQVSQAVARISHGLKVQTQQNLNNIVQEGKHFLAGWHAGPMIPGIFTIGTQPITKLALLEVMRDSNSIMQRFTVMTGIHTGVIYVRSSVDGGVIWLPWQSPAAVEQLANQVSAEDGYVTLPGGILMQWVKMPDGAPSGYRTINWPKPFTTAVFNVQATTFGASANVAKVVASDLNSVTVYRFSGNSADASAVGAMIFAVGE